MLSSSFLKYTLIHTRVPRVLLRKTLLIIMLILQTILPFFFKNKNIRHAKLKLPQPAYYNSFGDLDLEQELSSQQWIT